jgi:hypothetical protein
VHFDTEVCLYFLNQHKNTDLLIPIFTYFEEKNFLTVFSELTFLGPKTPFSQEMAKKIRKNVFCNLILEFFTQFKLVIVILKKAI